MWMSLLSVLSAGLLGVSPQIPNASAANQCAVCHLRQVWTTSAIAHVDEWVTSRHAVYGVGCEKCHGGDATTADETVAHRGVRNSADPSSVLHWMTLPSTCGGCHRGEANAFASSAHQALLTQGDAMAPTCTSCHSSMAADVPSPAALETRCRHCHHDERQDRAGVARRELNDLTALRGALKKATFQIAAVGDANRRASLTRMWKDADVCARAVASAIHSFDQRRVDDRLSDLRVQVGRLTAEIAHGSPTGSLEK